MQHLELSRPYFEREARFGRRVIFQWTPASCNLHKQAEAPDWCINCSTESIFEGVHFINELAAQSFDLDQTDHECDDGAWEWFDTWKAAQVWLREAE